ncbi:hypothetical protein [Hahella ganghwensis]|uniref:hypothetical protein n=1 Tax=Hahella ganghwensis TaxID=286420 RepID=UPI00037443C9|nr:hypothetical protein [Hahella ganghwensis]
MATIYSSIDKLPSFHSEFQVSLGICLDFDYPEKKPSPFTRLIEKNMQESGFLNIVLPILIVLTVVIGTYMGLHKVVELGMIKFGSLKPLSKTTLDDVRELRDTGQVYWALRRFRQIKKKAGQNLNFREGMDQLQKL